MTNQPKAYTVTAITRMIKTALEESFFDLWVEGEISNFKLHSSGHRYFDLKDENATIRCTMWRSAGAYLKFQPENGQHVRVHGDISVYEKNGSYQVNCKKMEPVGVGALELAFRQLYERLSKEGLFDESRKKELPAFPMKIGIVTSPTGAAIRDIIQIATRRNNSVQLILYPAKVQGDGAEETIAAGLDYFNTREDIDLVIVGRGGGSLEELWSFNTETTVRAVVRSRLPVISAVGHEIDTTLCDLAADLRAPTPSAAAELAVWSKAEFAEQVRSLLSAMTEELNFRIEQAREELRKIMLRPVYKRPMELVYQRQQHLDTMIRVLSSTGKIRFVEHKNQLSLLVSRLDTLSPLGILARGYSVTRRMSDHAIVKTSGDVRAGDQIETIVAEGRLVSKVESSSDRNEGAS
jgi:exodeoxyribonuclease VII large subunit